MWSVSWSRPLVDSKSLPVWKLFHSNDTVPVPARTLSYLGTVCVTAVDPSTKTSGTSGSNPTVFTWEGWLGNELLPCLHRGVFRTRGRSPRLGTTGDRCSGSWSPLSVVLGRSRYDPDFSPFPWHGTSSTSWVGPPRRSVLSHTHPTQDSHDLPSVSYSKPCTRNRIPHCRWSFTITKPLLVITFYGSFTITKPTWERPKSYLVGPFLGSTSIWYSYRGLLHPITVDVTHSAYTVLKSSSSTSFPSFRVSVHVRVHITRYSDPLGRHPT